MAKLYFYYSAMNAGKTTTLLQSSYNYRERGLETLLFTPALDTRYGQGVIASRIGLQACAQAFGKDFLFFEAVRLSSLGKKISCVFVDEAQFLTKIQVHSLTQVVDELHIPVLTYGLRTDFLGLPFEGSQSLLALADEIIEIKTICECGKKATMTLRLNGQGRAVASGNQIEIGGNEKYISLCRQHFKERLSQK